VLVGVYVKEKGEAASQCLKAKLVDLVKSRENRMQRLTGL